MLMKLTLGGVVLVGGYSENNTHLDTIYRLTHYEVPAKWEQMSQRLKVGRYSQTTFLIPDKITDCKETGMYIFVKI